MQLRPIAANQTELTLSNGTQVFFSYKTPVAAYLADQAKYVVLQPNGPSQHPVT